MNKLDMTYAGKLNSKINVIVEKKLDLLFTIEGSTGNPTTTSIKINNNLMITFDYQELKKIVEGEDENKDN